MGSAWVAYQVQTEFGEVWVTVCSVFLTFMILIMFYLKKNTENIELNNIYTSVIYLSVVNIGYFLISVFNQSYKLYFIPVKILNRTAVETSTV